MKVRPKVKSFPLGFLWGASISAHQVEGGNYNSWTVWEQANAERLAAEAPKHFAKTVPDWAAVKAAATDPQNYISGHAADHYIGLTSFRFSLEWSRIEPLPGQFDQEAILHYRDVIRTCKRLGMEPFVTIWHWTLPVWVEELGGWTNRDTVDYFARFVRQVVEELGSEVTFWLTLNEPEVYADYSFNVGDWPPNRHNFFVTFRVLKRLSEGHKAAYQIIKDRFPSAQVGISKHNISLAVDRRLMNVVIKFGLDKLWNLYFLQLIRGYQDFIGLNYYFHSRTNFSLRTSARTKFSDLGWELHPKGLTQVLQSLRRYKLPIYITENGLADADDVYRAQYLHDILDVIWHAINKGIDIRGYSHWSLLDNFEWDKGFWPRFGLIEVNYKTLARHPRKSSRVYAEIIKHNGIPQNH
jgi:beta-glucosidase